MGQNRGVVARYDVRLDEEQQSESELSFCRSFKVSKQSVDACVASDAIMRVCCRYAALIHLSRACFVLEQRRIPYATQDAFVKSGEPLSEVALQLSFS